MFYFSCLWVLVKHFDLSSNAKHFINKVNYYYIIIIRLSESIIWHCSDSFAIWMWPWRVKPVQVCVPLSCQDGDQLIRDLGGLKVVSTECCSSISPSNDKSLSVHQIISAPGVCRNRLNTALPPTSCRRVRHTNSPVSVVFKSSSAVGCWSINIKWLSRSWVREQNSH